MAPRSIAAFVFFSLMISVAQPARAMSTGRFDLSLRVQRVSLHEPSTRSLLIRHGVATLAVGPEWAGGWNVPIIGSARILPARLSQ